MSEFELSYEIHPEYLFVKGKGIRRNLEAIFQSTQEFARIVEDNKTKFILMDYSETVTHSSNIDVFNITRLYETKTPLMLELCIAIITNPAEFAQDAFWEDVCQKRGFNFKIFTDTSEAKSWLLTQVKNAE